MKWAQSLDYLGRKDAGWLTREVIRWRLVHRYATADA